jgi:DNA topoisomerase-1
MDTGMDTGMNITRILQKNNKNFVYYCKNSQVINKNTLERIRKLHIPPNWTNIKIADSETDYLQVTGEDSKGRTQYIYHPIFVELSKLEKYTRLCLFIKKLPILIKHINKKLTGKIDLNDKEYIIALLFRILCKTHSRIGNDHYAEENNTYGLTTLLKNHMTIIGDSIIFSFVGKKNIKQELIFTDKICNIVLKELKKIPGDRLFKTRDQQIIRSSDMNDYMKNIIGEDFSCKDFRTYASNQLFINKLYTKQLPINITQTKKTLNECYDEVANELGHSRAISRASYVMPSISQKYLENPSEFLKNKYTLRDFF